MGSWGTAISSNDTYADIYSAFFEEYNNAISVEEIATKLINSNKELLNDASDSNNFWFALAKAQWECKYVDEAVFNKVKAVIKTGTDINLWQELGASHSDLKKRKIALNKFLIEISTPRPKAKPIKKKVIKEPFYSKGDCITFTLANGNYGGAIILEAVYNTEQGLNLVAVTNLDRLLKPTVKDFKNAEVLIKTFAAHKDKAAIYWLYPVGHENAAVFFETIGIVNIEITYSTTYKSQKQNYAFSRDYVSNIIETANRQFEHELLNGASKQTLSIKKLINKPWWKLW